MNKNLQYFLCFIFFFELISSLAHAGSLYVEYYGISDFIKNSGTVILGTVITVNAVNGKITLMVKKVWHKGKDKPTLMVSEERTEENGQKVIYSSGIPVEISKPLDVSVYQGVVWNDEDKSPIDRRLYGHISVNDVKKDQEVILAQELLNATPEQINRIDRVFSENFASEYPSKATEKQLFSDLEDYSLSKIAIQELLKRNKISFKDIVDLKDEYLQRELIKTFVAAIKSGHEDQLFNDAKKILLGSVPYVKKITLFQALFEDLKPNAWGRGATLLNELLKEDNNHMQAGDKSSIQEALVRASKKLIESSKSKLDIKNINSVSELFWTGLELKYKNKDPEVDQIKHALLSFSKSFSAEMINHFLDVAFNFLHHLIVQQKGASSPLSYTTLEVLGMMVELHPSQHLCKSILLIPVNELKDLRDKEVYLDKMIEMAVLVAKKDSATIKIFKKQIEDYLNTEITTTSTNNQKGEAIFQVSMKLESGINSIAFDDYKKLFRK